MVSQVQQEMRLVITHILVQSFMSYSVFRTRTQPAGRYSYSMELGRSSTISLSTNTSTSTIG